MTASHHPGARVRAALGAWVAIFAAAAACSPSTPSPSASAPSSTPASSAQAALPLVVDTDVAPDDIIAISSLLRDPAVDVLAITVTGTGEAHCQGGMFVVRSIVTMLRDAPVPVTCGRDTPIGDAEPFPDAWRAGADAGSGISIESPTFAPDPRSAEDVLLELARSQVDAGRRLTVLTLGTLTNLASAVAKDPSFAGQVELVSMLGAVSVPGNVAPGMVAEWNAHADPSAVRAVLDAGFDMTIIPLDATNSVPMRDELYADLESDHAAGPADLVYELWSRNSFTRGEGVYLWDPLAAAGLRDRSLVTTREATVRVVEGAGPDGGKLVEDAAGARVVVATAADQARFEAFLLSRLRSGGPRPNTFTPIGTLTVDLKEASCDVGAPPSPLRSGLYRVDATNRAGQQASVIAFGLAGVPWDVIEEFAASPPTGPNSTAPPVLQIAFVELADRASSSGFGEVPAGSIGIACIVGPPERPVVLLQGPFEVAP